VKREKDRSNLLTRRAVLLGGAQVALLATLAGRMYYLQVVQSDRYVMLADENRINIRLVAPPRGLIVDRFGAVLADNKPTYRVVLVSEQAGDIESTLNAVGQLIPVSDADRRRVLRDIRRKHSFVPVIIRENLSWDEMARIEVNTLEVPGVSIERGLTRFYPFGESASHVLGYVAAVSEAELNGDDPLLELPGFRIGKEGIERTYDIEMRGSAGTSQVEVNAFGRVVRELTREEGIPGQEMVLTLDMALQDLAARKCLAEKSAACVLMDAWTGDVLALVSMPSYDPSAFAMGLPQSVWDELQHDPRNPLGNKAIGGGGKGYPPGSTFKPVVALAALETGAMTPDTHVFCTGEYPFGDHIFHCWKKGGHGSMNLRDGIKHSCDSYFYETSRRLGIDPIAAMAKRFGLGAPLGIDLPGEAPGFIPTTQWKKTLSKDPVWHPGETLSCGIGQGYVLATVLQLATYAARLATGRAVVPHLVREAGVMTATGNASGGAANSQFPLLEVSAKDLKLVLDGMNAVVNEQGGTAYAARISDPGLQMGGKSGTSQVQGMSKLTHDKHVKIKDTPWEERDHALFISFAPVSQPRYVCAVIVEHGGESAGGGSAVAAPICRDMLREAQKRDPAVKVPDQPFGPTVATVAQG
jgi:penicillin-binding protein 2